MVIVFLLIFLLAAFIAMGMIVSIVQSLSGWALALAVLLILYFEFRAVRDRRRLRQYNRKSSSW